MRPFGTYARLGASLVAVVELLLLAVVTDVVVGAGYPYFKVCNTFAQIGAALADAAPAWLCALGTTRRRAQQASLRRRRGRQRLRSRRSRRWRSCRAASLPAALRVTSSPYDISEFTCWAPIAQAARALRFLSCADRSARVDVMKFYLYLFQVSSNVRPLLVPRSLLTI